MSKTTDLLPIFEPQQFIKGDEILIPRYRQGDPRNYRLDLGKGVLNLEGRKPVTKSGEPIKVIPVAFRCLEHGLFGQELKKWCEVYFINHLGHLSMFMFHGYSVANLSQAARDLFYEDCSLCEVVWTVKLEQKVNKEGQKYYMADFLFEAVKEEDLVILKGLQKNIISKYSHIYRGDTADCKTLHSENWSDGKEPTAEEIEQEAERQKGLLQAFATKEEKAAQQAKGAENKKPMKQTQAA